MTPVAEVSRFRYTIAMATKPLARDELWEIATAQHGFVTAQQAIEAGIGKQALQMLVHRGTLKRAAHGGPVARNGAGLLRHQRREPQPHTPHRRQAAPLP